MLSALFQTSSSLLITDIVAFQVHNLVLIEFADFALGPCDTCGGQLRRERRSVVANCVLDAVEVEEADLVHVAFDVAFVENFAVLLSVLPMSPR